MAITEDNIKIGDTFKLEGPYSCTIKIKLIKKFKYVTGAIAPYIEDIDECYESIQKDPHPIFYGMTDNDWIRDTWFTFRDHVTDRLLGDNIVGIYPDDEDYSFRVWCEKDGIHKITHINK